MNNIKNYDIVFVSDKIKNHLKTSIFTNSLEVPELYYYNEMIDSLSKIGKSLTVYNNPRQLIKNISSLENPVIISLWSGKKSRNRKILIPAIAESLKIPYLGADAFSCSICSDKVISKEYAKKFGIKTANYVMINSKQDISSSYSINFPAIVKPINEGGSIGISSQKSIVYNANEANNLINSLIKKFKRLMIEEYIPGYEVSVLMFGNSKKIIHKGVTQLVLDNKTYFTDQIFGYEEKKVNCNCSEIDGTHLSKYIPWNQIEQLFLSFDKIELIRFDGRIFNNAFYLIEMSPDAYLGSDGSVGSFFLNVLEKNHIEMLEMLLANTLNFQDH